MPGFHYSSKICTKCGGQLIRYETGIDNKRQLISTRCPKCADEADDIGVVSIEEIDLRMPLKEKLIRNFSFFKKLNEWVKSPQQKMMDRYHKAPATFFVNETNFPLYLFDDEVAEMRPVNPIGVGYSGDFPHQVDSLNYNYGFFSPSYAQIETVLFVKIYLVDQNEETYFLTYLDRSFISFVECFLFDDHEWSQYFKNDTIYKYVNDEAVQAIPIVPIEIEHKNGEKVIWHTKTFQTPMPFGYATGLFGEFLVTIAVLGDLNNDLTKLLQSLILQEEVNEDVKALDQAYENYDAFKTARHKKNIPWRFQ